MPEPAPPLASDAPDGSVLGPERGALTIGLLLAVGAFAVEGMGVVPALPTAVGELGGMTLFGWSFSGFMLAWLVGSVWAGAAADALGPRRPMALGLAGFGAGLLLAALSRGMPQFLLGRALQGAGGGAMLASAYVAVSRGYPDALRARMMALTSSVWILPAVVGPAASGFVTLWLGWRWVFAGITPLLALVAALVLRPLRRFDRSGPPASTQDAWRSLRLALGSGLILAALSVRSAAWAASLACLLAGAALAAPALSRLLPPGTLLARRGLPASLAVRASLAFAFFGTEAFIPLGAARLRGQTPTAAALALTAAALGWIGTAWLQERIEARHGASVRASLVRVGFVMISAAIAIVTSVLLTDWPFLLTAAGWALGGAGCGLTFSAGGLLCLAAAPPGKEGEVSGQLQIAESLGTAAGTGLGGALLAILADAHFSPREAHGLVFGGTLLVALSGVVIAGRAAR